jgi:hypothetical protein
MEKMMIETQMLEFLLNSFDLGSSTAENDPLLEIAKIETQEYFDLYYNDRIDIVKGIKGSGKTALYRLFYFLKDYSIEKKNLHCIFGVEASGDPVFRLFKDDFIDYNEIEFENFWNIYFILLITNYIDGNTDLKEKLGKEIVKLKKIIDDLGIRIEKYGYSIKDSISVIQKFFRSLKVSGSITPSLDPQNPLPIPAINFERSKLEDVKQKPIYISEFREEISKILKKSGIKIWIMLDRLDEVFPHRSDIEKNGLTGLLKASYNFSCIELRIKIFLRDDIVDFISSNGFTALTHVFDRCSNTMTWSKEQVLLLIVKRLSAIENIAGYYGINNDHLIESEYRNTVFESVFPEKVGKTKTIDWLYNNIGDGNGIVTPRDVIDFFKFLKNEQLKSLKIDPKPQEKLFTEDHFKEALNRLSKHKKTIFLYAEFPNMKESFLRFEGGYSEYDVSTLKEMFPENYDRTIEDLKSIGFLKFNHKHGTFKVPIIWRKGFNIINRKAKNA